MANVLLLGGSGLVGHEALRLALNHDVISKVVAPTRRPLSAHPKLVNPVSSTLDALVPALQAGNHREFLAAGRRTLRRRDRREAQDEYERGRMSEHLDVSLISPPAPARGGTRGRCATYIPAAPIAARCQRLGSIQESETLQ